MFWAFSLFWLEHFYNFYFPKKIWTCTCPLKLVVSKNFIFLLKIIRGRVFEMTQLLFMIFHNINILYWAMNEMINFYLVIIFILFSYKLWLYIFTRNVIQNFDVFTPLIFSIIFIVCQLPNSIYIYIYILRTFGITNFFFGLNRLIILIN